MRRALYYYQVIQRHTQFTKLSTSLQIHAGEFPTYELSLIDNGEVVAHCAISQSDESMERFDTEILTVYATLPKYGIKLQ